MTFLELHKFLLKNGIDAENGLCMISKDIGLASPYLVGTLEYNDTFKLFEPYPEEETNAWWGDDERGDNGATYGPLRQTIILFCAAIEGEL